MRFSRRRICKRTLQMHSYVLRQIAFLSRQYVCEGKPVVEPPGASLSQTCFCCEIGGAKLEITPHPEGPLTQYLVLESQSMAKLGVHLRSLFDGTIDGYADTISSSTAMRPLAPCDPTPKKGLTAKDIQWSGPRGWEILHSKSPRGDHP